MAGLTVTIKLLSLCLTVVGFGFIYVKKNVQNALISIFPSDLATN